MPFLAGKKAILSFSAPAYYITASRAGGYHARILAFELPTAELLELLPTKAAGSPPRRLGASQTPSGVNPPLPHRLPFWRWKNRRCWQGLRRGEGRLPPPPTASRFSSQNETLGCRPTKCFGHFAVPRKCSPMPPLRSGRLRRQASPGNLARYARSTAEINEKPVRTWE